MKKNVTHGTKTVLNNIYFRNPFNMVSLFRYIFNVRLIKMVSDFEVDFRSYQK